MTTVRDVLIKAGIVVITTNIQAVKTKEKFHAIEAFVKRPKPVEVQR